MLKDSAGKRRAEIVARSENVAHDQRAEHDAVARVAPVAKVHVEAGILQRPGGEIDHIFRSLEAVAAGGEAGWHHELQ